MVETYPNRSAMHELPYIVHSKGQYFIKLVRVNATHMVEVDFKLLLGLFLKHVIDIESN
jgi:hypothetical protein